MLVIICPTVADRQNRYGHCRTVNTTNKGSLVQALRTGDVSANAHVTALKMDWTDWRAAACSPASFPSVCNSQANLCFIAYHF